MIVHVQLPDTSGPEETILISALSYRDGGTRQFATVTTELWWGRSLLAIIRMSYQAEAQGI